MKQRNRKPILFIVGAVLSISAKAENVGIDSAFGRDNKFWDNVNTLKSSSAVVNDLERVFDSNYKDPTEGILKVSASFVSDPPDVLDRFFDRGLIRVNYDRLVGGEIYNRISPQLRGYSLWTTSFNARAIKAADEDKSDIGFSIGNEIGFGRQRLLDSSLTELLLDSSEIKSTVFFYGIDLGLEWKTMVTPNMRFASRYSYLPTYFHSAFKDPNYEFRVESGKFFHRWRSESDFAVLWRGGLAGEFGVQAIFGQQPTPTLLTPRVWDAIHSIEAFPSFGSSIGMGSFIRIYGSSRKYAFDISGGFYGGYVGGSANLKLNHFHIQAGTYGLEQTAGFQVRETRLNYISGGIRYAW